MLILLTAACSSVNEELLECAPPPNTYTRVNFVYDYNMQYVDLFDHHAGTVYLYVFDENGVMLFRETKSKVDMEDDIDFSMTFDDTQIEPGKTYNFVAMAQGNHAGYDSSLETPGFQLGPDVEMVAGKSTIDDFIIRLDRDNDGDYDFGIVNYKDAYGNNTQMIDTVWSTKPDEMQTVEIPTFPYVPTPIQQPDNIVDVTIPMMRLTNAIYVNLVNSGFDDATDPESYMMLVYFPDGNGTIDFTGTTYPAQPLYYRTLRKSVIQYNPGESNIETGYGSGTRADTPYALQGLFGVSRLQMNDQSSLQIRDPETSDILVEIPDFSAFLANAFDQYGEAGQEFLDREYNFEVSILPKDITDPSDPENNWVWIDLYIDVINWYVRINNIEFNP